MIERIVNYLSGYLKIQITGYSPERFLNLCKNKDIYIWDLEAKENTYEMHITVKGFRKLKPILKKTHTKLVILERYGTPFFLYRYRKRKMFFVGSVICIALIFVLSKFIWNIEIEGNQSITDETIIEYLEQESVFHGMKRKDVECEWIATELRKDFNEIIWVSVSLEGTNLIIHVKENTDTFQVSQIEEEPSDIIAKQDGIITEIIMRSGVPCVSVGDEIKQGDVLVSGTVEVKNDAGEVIREDYKDADADIFAEVILNYQDFCETKHSVKAYTDSRMRTLFCEFLGMQFSFGDQSYKTEMWEIESYTNQLKINKHFLLPIFIGEKRAKEYAYVEVNRSIPEKESILNHNLQQYCEELEEKGIQILEQNVSFRKEARGLKASGTIKVITPIGTERKRIDL